MPAAFREPGDECRQRGAGQQGDEQQEPCRRDQPKAGDPCPHQAADHGPTGRRRRLPDLVQGGLQLGEDAAGGQQQGDHADDAGEGACGEVAGTTDHCLDGLCPAIAQQGAELVGDGPLDRLTTEGKARDGGGDDKQRCDGEDGVIGPPPHPFQGLAGPGRGELTAENGTDFRRLLRDSYILPVRPESPHRRMPSNESSIPLKRVATPEHRPYTLKRTANKKHPERGGSNRQWRRPGSSRRR